MNAFKQIIKPKGRHISFDLPEEFERNSEVEIIVLSFEKQVLRKKEQNILASQKGLFANIDSEKKQKMLMDLDNLRNEWERNIL